MDRSRKHNHLDISESGTYAYLSICSISLSELFPGEWNHEFNIKYIKGLCEHLKAPEKVSAVMLVLVDGNSGHTVEPYIELLLQEPNLNKKPILIVQDAVLYAVNMTHDREEKDAESKKRDKIRKIKRYTSIGIATVAGGTLIGLTGGLAAPFIGVGVGTILGGASAAALTSTAGVAIIGSIFGVAGAGLTGYKMNKRVGKVEEFSFEPLSRFCNTDQQLHVAIAVTGWLKNQDIDNVRKPWKCLAISREQYALRYETKYLVEMGQALEYILSMAVSFATQEALKYTILAGIMSAIAWPAALLSIASVIDNPWSVCCRRSSEVGKHLAHVLLSREHGKRPVTLIGYSLGARVIFYCLRELAEVGNAEGIIQDAIMLGAPVTDKSNQWEKCSRVVAGKIINGYCNTDWLLRFLYRTLSMATGVAGLAEVKCPRVTNIDLTSIISGHTEYSDKLVEIMEFVGVRTRSADVLDDEGVLKKSTSDYTEMGRSRKSTYSNKKLRIRASKSDECLNILPMTQHGNKLMCWSNVE
ncbi:Similar to TMCO4: Transmembrane and coiled-coil domain-containing protein 4 (Homo sapiens) [Cotesia congregata]|uniref:Similar to TMCO4: Transmembrane and coiled-coil domain-containing protein 4 (Homo sapiens) n=1 Tax=Cotesia congregata TaxID=51543 RepID=A0A8J2HDE0_COTCN|nr:Similar to TMCO4: Transmembrane and coiled-coil domain-containing protein 4 (Homo sapiens) [Cotesia congregata]